MRAYDTVKGIINFRTAILYIVSVWGLASQFIPALDILSKIEFFVKTKLFDFFYSREYREIEPQLKILRGESETE